MKEGQNFMGQAGGRSAGVPGPCGRRQVGSGVSPDGSPQPVNTPPRPHPVRRSAVDAERSVTEWITLARNGDPESAQKLYDRYVRQLTDLARRWLKSRGAPRRAEDEE